MNEVSEASPASNGSDLERLVSRLWCWWFGCESHPQDPAPPEYAHCMRCDECVTYGDMVGDTRHNRFKDWLRRHSWRRLWPKKCADCGNRFKCDESVEHDDIPF